MMMRKATDTSGKCCTVQRTLRDDSVVVRVDGVMGESTVDPTPLTVVRTTNPRHDPGVKLIYLHDKACVDATVEQWPERTIDVKEGSRHRLRVQSQTTNGWVTWRLKDGTEQLQPPKEAEGGVEWLFDHYGWLGSPDRYEGEGATLQVVSAKPLKVSGTIDEKGSEKVGMLAPRTLMTVLEHRMDDHGQIRANIGTIASEAAILTAALNEFNHAVQRFPNVTEYEAARSNYCEDIVSKEAMVEDAITGNMLRIKDQTLHVSTATDVVDNLSIPPEWRVDE